MVTHQKRSSTSRCMFRKSLNRSLLCFQNSRPILEEFTWHNSGFSFSRACRHPAKKLTKWTERNPFVSDPDKCSAKLKYCETTTSTWRHIIALYTKYLLTLSTKPKPTTAKIHFTPNTVFNIYILIIGWVQKWRVNRSYMTIQREEWLC